MKYLAKPTNQFIEKLDETIVENITTTTQDYITTPDNITTTPPSHYKSMLYTGSCRYMYNYEWNYFPARLHTTKEFIFFLNNIDNIENVINSNPSELTNYIFADIFNPGVADQSYYFMNNIKNYIKNITHFVLEICSRKVFYYNDIPLNYHNTRYKTHYIQKYNLKMVKLKDYEISKDLDTILYLSKKIFNKNIKLYIIPHLNLKTRATNDYIPERNEFVKLLELLCENKNIKIHNIGKYIENNNMSQNSNCYLEDYMPDSTHYITGIDINTLLGF